jgi:hypothetical protein
MGSAATNLVGTRIKKEVTFGTNPAGAFQELRYTNSSLAHNKQTLLSETITANRLRDFLAEVAASAEGEIGWELAFGTEADILLEAMMFAPITTADVGPADLDVTANSPSAGQSTITGASFSTFKPGSWVRTKAFGNAANNGVAKVLSADGTQIVLERAGFTELGSGDEEVHMKIIRNGNTSLATPFSITMEQYYSDINQYLYFRGMRINEFSLQARAQEIVTASISLLGLEGLTGQASASTTPAGTTDPLNATTNVGNITEGGSALATGVRSCQLTVNNNLRQSFQIGAKFPRDVLPGFADVSGTLEVYFENLTMYNKFLQHTASSFSMRFTDAAGNIFVFTMPRIQFATGAPSVPGGNEDVILPMEFTALRDLTVDPNQAHSLQIDILAP